MVEPDLVAETKSTSLVKSLLLQLLDLNIGNLRLLKELNVALDMHSVGSPAADIEDVLWRALSVGLNQEHRTTLIIDGLDHISGGQTASLRVLDRLRSITSSCNNVKTVVLSCPFEKVSIPHVKHFGLEPRLLQGDIRLFVSSLVTTSPQMRSLREDDRARIVEQISIPADGSFLWAKITFSTICKQNTLSAIMKSLESTTKGIEFVLERLIFSLDLQHPDTRSLLAWMLTAQRPLRLTEVKKFFELDLTESQHVPRFSDVRDDVQRSLGDIVDIRDGFVRFIHTSVRDLLLQYAGSVKDLSNTGKFPFMLKEAHFDMSTRCLAYLKIFFTRFIEPSVTSISSDTMNDLFHNDPLMEYAVRYWAIHFEASPMYQPDGKHKLVPTFKKNFSPSVFLAALERISWEDQVPSTQLMHLYTLALNLRVNILSNQDPSVLQTNLALASLYQRLDETEKANQTFYNAYEQSITLFGRDSKVTRDCAIGYLGSVQTIKITTRNDTSTRMESILAFIIEASKSTKTSTEDIIKYSTKLADLYTSIGEQEKAIITWRQVYELSAEAFGTFDIQTTKTYNTLLTTLRNLNRHDEVIRVQRFAYDRARKSLSVTDSRRHSLAVELIQLYEKQSNATGVEEILVDEWQALTTAASSNRTDLHDKKLALSVQYAQFLRQSGRTSEAQNILLGTWTEYKDRTDVRSETMMTSFVTLAQEMEQVQMIDTAHSILLSVWNESKVSNQYTTLTQAIAAELLQTTQHMVNTKKEVTDSDLTIEESIMEDIAQTTTSYTVTTKGRKGSSTGSSSFSTADSLSMFYIRQERWTDAVRICTAFLQKAWPLVLQNTDLNKITLPTELRAEVLSIAVRLAECYFNASQTTESEELLHRIFAGTKNTLPITDKHVLDASSTLIKFLESTHQFRKALQVHEIIYNAIKEKHGPKSNEMVQMGYECARYCLAHNLRKEAEPFYLDIYTAMTKKSKTFPEHGLEAAQWLEELYTKEHRWKEARPVYQTIWQAIISYGKQYGFTEEYVQRFFSNYVSVIAKHYGASYSEIRQVCIQYRETSIVVFGEESETSLKATYELAAIDEQSQDHHDEAVELYNLILSKAEKRKTTSTLSTTLLHIVRETKRQVAHLYTGSTSTSKEAVSIFGEQYQSAISERGFADKSTLEQQHQLVIALMKEDSVENKTRVLQVLQTAVANIVSSEKHSTRLSESGTEIAKTYIETGNKDTAITILGKLRRQLIFGEVSKDLDLKLDRTDRSAFAFVAAFERAIYTERQFSEIMSQLMTESMRYEAYHKAVAEKAKLGVVVLRGCQLLEFLQQQHRQADYDHIRSDMLRNFKALLGVSVQAPQLQAFFEIVVTRISAVEKTTTTLETVVERVLAHTNSSKFLEAYELALLEYRYMTIHEELEDIESIKQGFRLALYLTGRGTNHSRDASLSAKMLHLSKEILTLILTAAHHQHMQFHTLPLDEINMLAGLLGQHGMYLELEALLTNIWTSRHAQQTWTSATIVSLGRRLIEARFAAGRHDSAIHLAQDIIYNLRRVWGELDATTLSFWDLLGELHSAAGNFAAAQNVHEEVLRQCIVGAEDGDLSGDKAAEIAVEHLDLIRAAFERGKGWSKDVGVYGELLAQLRAEFGNEASWKGNANAKTEIEKWTAGKETPKMELGLWKQPTSWEFVSVDDSKMHRNNLRKISGLFSSSSASSASGEGIELYLSGVGVNGKVRGGNTYGQELHGAKFSLVK